MSIDPDAAAEALAQSDENLLAKPKKGKSFNATERKRLAAIAAKGKSVATGESVPAPEPGKTYARTQAEACEFLDIEERTMRRVRSKNGMFQKGPHGYGPLEDWRADYARYLDAAKHGDTKPATGTRALGSLPIAAAGELGLGAREVYQRMQTDEARLYATKEAAWADGDVEAIMFTTKLWERSRDALMKAENSLKDEQKKTGELMHQDVARAVFFQLGAAIARTGMKGVEKHAKQAATMKDPRAIAKLFFEVIPDVLLDFVELAVEGDKLPAWAFDGLEEGLGIPAPKASRRKKKPAAKKARKKRATKKPAKRSKKKPQSNSKKST